jgi:hypothetical protein
MPLYNVIWEIDIDAETPKEAAQKARVIQHDANSTATIFSVSNQKGTTHTIDLEK